jgi:hypothetical protein
MTRRFIAMSALLAFAGVSSIALIWQGAPRHGTGSHGAQASAPIDEGGRKHEVLRHLTEIYVARGEGEVTTRMRKGLELAPVAFLNDELARQGVKWRVKQDEAAAVEFFDIS